mgnify:CR=1 FL=1
MLLEYSKNKIAKKTGSNRVNAAADTIYSCSDQLLEWLFSTKIQHDASFTVFEVVNLVFIA